MSLEHDELLMDRLSAQATPPANQSAEEKELQLLLDQKQQLMMKQSQEYLNELFRTQGTTPVVIKNAQITNSQTFRYGFLQQQFKTLTSKNMVTIQELFLKIDEVNENLSKLSIVENCQVSVQQLPRNLWNRNKVANEVVPIFNIVPMKKFYAKTGTNIGNGEGDGYIQFQLKNLFGGAENLIFDAITGTKTHSSYLLNYNQPLFNRANYILENCAFINTKTLDWLNSEVKTRGLTNKIYTQFSGNVNHELVFDNSWRTLDNTTSKSLDILNQLGHDFKSSILYNFRYDTRNNKHLPSEGKFLRLGVEYSGLWKFNSSRYFKFIYESQLAQRLSENNFIVATSKAGLILPFHSASHVLDRFYIGGPTDVRSFTINGLGPKSYNSSIGGDYFVNGGISLITNIPKYETSNFKFHNFLNFGKLLPFNSNKSTKQLVKDITTNHSVSYGFGILYNHPMARFELNFVLPLAAHERDYIRKGLQYGIGISFL